MDHKAMARRLISLNTDQGMDQAVAQLSDLRPIDIADTLTHLDVKVAAKIVERLENRSTVFSYLNKDSRIGLLNSLNSEYKAELIGKMPADERTDLYKQLNQTQRDALLPALAQVKREDIRQLAVYEEGTAGAIMTSDYASLKAEMNVEQSLESLRLEAPDAETIYHAYVIDDQRHLMGVVSLRNLILADPDDCIRDIMLTSVIFAKVTDDQDSVAKKIARYDLIALPVVNDDGALVGIVTHDDAMDVASAEATEDFRKSGGISSFVGSFKNTSIRLLYRKRVFWLVLLVFGNLISGVGISHYEDIIAANLVLVFFLPLLVDSGGNAGSQSATLMVRALATGEVEMRDWFTLLGREAIVALLLGITMAMAISLIGYIRGDAIVSLVLALSMVSVVMIGCIIGMSLPFLLNKFGLDPASASAPLITSVCDASGVIIYLFIASRFLTL